ncbi:MAG: type II toxin-antitoxin system PemK/MazF family toxin, partial [Dongiaceae bacterium]
GDYGKPRPALVIQSDLFAEHPSVTVLLLTGELHDALLLRVTVQPTPENGLEKASQICVDKAATLPRAKIGQRIGRLDDATLLEVSRRLALFLGFV